MPPPLSRSSPFHVGHTQSFRRVVELAHSINPASPVTKLMEDLYVAISMAVNDKIPEAFSRGDPRLVPEYLATAGTDFF